MKLAKPNAEEASSPYDVEFLPLKLLYKVHRSLLGSQVEIVPVPWYYKPVEVEYEPEAEVETEPEVRPLSVTYAAPLKPLQEGENWWDLANPCYA